MTAELPCRGRAVRVPDNFSTGSRENLAAVGGEVELVEGGVRSHERTHAAAQGARCVIPPGGPTLGAALRAGSADHKRGQRHRDAERGARGAGTKRVVFASASSVYGRAQELPKTESWAPQPISPYGVSKRAAEEYRMGLNVVYGIEVAV